MSMVGTVLGKSKGGFMVIHVVGLPDDNGVVVFAHRGIPYRMRRWYVANGVDVIVWYFGERYTMYILSHRKLLGARRHNKSNQQWLYRHGDKRQNKHHVNKWQQQHVGVNWAQAPPLKWQYEHSMTEMRVCKDKNHSITSRINITTTRAWGGRWLE